MRIQMQGPIFGISFQSNLKESQKCSWDFLEEVQSVVLEIDELEPKEKSHAYALNKILSQLSFRWDEKKMMFFISKLFKL